MALFLDVIIILIIALCIFIGWKRGFIRSIMGIISFIVAFVCATNFTPALSAYFLDNVFYEKVTGVVSDAIYAIIGTGIGSISFDTLFVDKPDAFVSMIERFGMSMETLEEYYNANLADGVSNAAEKVAEYMAQPIASALSQAVAFLTIFLGALIVLKLITLILDLIFKLPVLKTANKVGGVIVGVVNAALYSWVAAVIIAAIIPVLIKLYPGAFAESMLDNTVLVKLLSTIDIFKS